MAKPTRRPASAQTHRTVKTSVHLDHDTHIRLAALAAMRGVPMTAIMAEAIADAVNGIVVFDRSSKGSKAVDSPVQVKDSAGEPGRLAS